jgi:hypothetical protein
MKKKETRLFVQATKADYNAEVFQLLENTKSGYVIVINIKVFI